MCPLNELTLRSLKNLTAIGVPAMQPILAIDLGKNKSVFCDYGPLDSKHQFGTVPTSPQDVHDLLHEVSPAPGGH